MKASPISCDETSARRWRVTVVALAFVHRALVPDPLGDELAHRIGHVGRRRHPRDAGGERGARSFCVVPHGEEARDDHRPGAHRRGRRARVLVHRDRAGVEGQGHGGHEEAGLPVEVVVDEGRVHLGLPRHRPQARPVIALGGEDALGRLDDLALGVDVARPAAGSGSGGTHMRSRIALKRGYSPVGNSVLQLTNDESYGGTTVMRATTGPRNGPSDGARAAGRRLLRPPPDGAGPLDPGHHRHHGRRPDGGHPLREQVHGGEHPVAAGDRTFCRPRSRRSRATRPTSSSTRPRPSRARPTRRPSTRWWPASSRCPTSRA